ncbi:MAG: hypothetical protein QOE92_2548 [Chloroflexota bacterium]|jgi:spore germination protein YaaH|nr:hypothetical protein [Chloroflexota bacterium]
MTLPLAVGGAVAGGLVFINDPGQPAFFELDGRRLEATANNLPPSPSLVLKLDRPGRPAGYHVSLDGHEVALTETSDTSALVRLDGPLPQSSSHRLEAWSTDRFGRRVALTVLDFRTADPLALAVGWTAGDDVQAEVSWSAAPASTSAIEAAIRDAGGEPEVHDGGVTGRWPRTAPDYTLRFAAAGVTAVNGGFLPAAFESHFAPGPGAVALVQVSNQAPVDGAGMRLHMYFVDTATGRADLAAHARQVAVLSPNFYSVDGGGELHSSVDPAVIATATAAGTEVQPLVTNTDFDAVGAHELLTIPGRVDGVADRLVAEARGRGYTGYQLDFENVNPLDRTGLTDFSKGLGSRLKAAGLAYSVAAVPTRLPGAPNVFAAPYDYAALGSDGSPLTLMAYDEHTRAGDPGPVAGLDWVRQVLEASGQGVPSGNLYLGVPLYNRDFATSGSPVARGYEEALDLAVANHAGLTWDFQTSSAFFKYSRDNVAHIVWMDNAASLRAKLTLAREKGLAGVSAWRMGFEDPAFWDLWPSR